MVPVFWTISVMTTECLLISVVIKAIVSPRTAQYLVYFVILYIVYVILEQHSFVPLEESYRTLFHVLLPFLIG